MSQLKQNLPPVKIYINLYIKLKSIIDDEAGNNIYTYDVSENSESSVIGYLIRKITKKLTTKKIKSTQENIFLEVEFEGNFYQYSWATSKKELVQMQQNNNDPTKIKETVTSSTPASGSVSFASCVVEPGLGDNLIYKLASGTSPSGLNATGILNAPDNATEGTVTVTGTSNPPGC